MQLLDRRQQHLQAVAERRCRPYILPSCRSFSNGDLLAIISGERTRLAGLHSSLGERIATTNSEVLG